VLLQPKRRNEREDRVITNSKEKAGSMASDSQDNTCLSKEERIREPNPQCSFSSYPSESRNNTAVTQPLNVLTGSEKKKSSR
jgi:hypothetical protein